MMARDASPSAICVHRRLSAVALTVLLLMPICLLAGCNPGSGSRPVSLTVWQTQIQAYVNNHGNGDINTLHTVEIAPGQPGFRSFSNDRPEQSKDFAGVLVGVHPQASAGGERLWYVYVVGEIDKEQVTALRLAAVSQDAGKLAWQIGGDDGGVGAAAYLASRQKAWRDQHADATPPRSALGFPSNADQFTMTASGDVLTVREGTSGAQWTLSLTDQSAPR